LHQAHKAVSAALHGHQAHSSPAAGSSAARASGTQSRCKSVSAALQVHQAHKTEVIKMAFAYRIRHTDIRNTETDGTGKTAEVETSAVTYQGYDLK